MSLSAEGCHFRYRLYNKDDKNITVYFHKTEYKYLLSSLLMTFKASLSMIQHIYLFRSSYLSITVLERWNLTFLFGGYIWSIAYSQQSSTRIINSSIRSKFWLSQAFVVRRMSRIQAYVARFAIDREEKKK
jgi:hypothetical protein